MCYMHEYDDTLASAHISQLEAINCMVAVRALICPDHQGMTVMVERDNSTAVAIFRTGQGRDQVILACTHAIWRHAAAVDCALQLKHTPGELMHSADALSHACLSPRHEVMAWEVVHERGLQVMMISHKFFDYAYFL